MAEIILLHSAQGLRPGVLGAAEALREGGHVVRTPDYYDGEVFDDLESGLRKRDTIGFEELGRRWRAIGEQARGPVVFAGFSLGGFGAQVLAATHPLARGALLYHGCAAVPEVSDRGWPVTVPMQLHYAEGDPWVDADDVRSLRTELGPIFACFIYPGNVHLFADPDLPGYSAESASLMWKRSRDFISLV
ncbi:dienelactone hydrolase family protein [Nonomuraea sp. WAC 01424]|uniref:dienelactone hydrolase family protein n=1 Tax=Nonomuraea sp. WAC 01424 TaxID=2203200 RepID=UPI00163CA085|nr:dienelactone hydrolase family protein [Nonomuraea sp. WAC 01424]